MELGIGGKVAIVSGGSRGIGRAIAEGLAAEGANLAIAARPGRRDRPWYLGRNGNQATNFDYPERDGPATFRAGNHEAEKRRERKEARESFGFEIQYRRN